MPAEEVPSSSPVPEGGEFTTPPAPVDDAALRAALVWFHGEINKSLRPDDPSLANGPANSLNTISEITEDEPPKTIDGNPVLVVGDPIQLKREGTRARLATIVLCIFGGVVVAYVVASFRLDPAAQVRELREMISLLLPVTVGALVAFYFHNKGR